MKRIAAILLTLAVYPVSSYAAEAPPAAEAEVGRVYALSGEVTVAGGKAAGTVKTSGPIYPGTLVRTSEDGTALLKFVDGQIVTMQPATAFEVREYHYDAIQAENSKVDCALLEGGVHLVTGLIGRSKRLAFSLWTPTATIRGGQADIAVVKAGNIVQSRVLGGEIRMTNSAGTASFKAGQSPVVPSSLRLASAFYPSISRDLFSEVLSISVTPPVIVEPEPETAPALAAAPEAPAAALPAPEAEAEPSPETAAAAAPEEPAAGALEPAATIAAEAVPPVVSVPVPGELVAVMPEARSTEATPEPAPAPAPETEPPGVPEPVTAGLPPPPEPLTLPLSAPDPAPVAESVSLPVPAAPACTCTCTSTVSCE